MDKSSEMEGERIMIDNLDCEWSEAIVWGKGLRGESKDI